MGVEFRNRYLRYVGYLGFNTFRLEGRSVGVFFIRKHASKKWSFYILLRKKKRKITHENDGSISLTIKPVKGTSLYAWDSVQFTKKPLFLGIILNHLPS